MTTRNEIVAIARGFLGVRFAHQGRRREAGLDCLGFLLAVAEEARLELRGVSPCAYDRRDYGARPDTAWLQQQLATLLVPVSPAHSMPADILLLRIDGRPQHLALVSDHGIIHAYAPARKVVEHRLDERWKRAIAGVYRLPQLLEGEGQPGTDEPVTVAGV